MSQPKKVVLVLLLSVVCVVIFGPRLTLKFSQYWVSNSRDPFVVFILLLLLLLMMMLLLLSFIPKTFQYRLVKIGSVIDAKLLLLLVFLLSLWLLLFLMLLLSLLLLLLISETYY